MSNNKSDIHTKAKSCQDGAVGKGAALHSNRRDEMNAPTGKIIAATKNQLESANPGAANYLPAKIGTLTQIEAMIEEMLPASNRADAASTDRSEEQFKIGVRRVDALEEVAARIPAALISEAIFQIRLATSVADIIENSVMPDAQEKAELRRLQLYQYSALAFLDQAFGTNRASSVFRFYSGHPLNPFEPVTLPAARQSGAEDPRIAELCEAAERAYAAYCAAPDTNTDEEDEILIVPMDKAEDELIRIPARTFTGAVQKLLASTIEEDGRLAVRVDGLFESAVSDLRRLADGPELDARIAELREVIKQVEVEYDAAAEADKSARGLSDEAGAVILKPMNEASGELVRLPATTYGGASKKLLASLIEQPEGYHEASHTALFESAIADMKRLESCAS